MMWINWETLLKIFSSVGLVDPFPSKKIPRYLIVSLGLRGIIGWLLKFRGIVSWVVLGDILLGKMWIRSDLDGLTYII